MHIAFIVCDNGLGHVRRAAAVIAALRAAVPAAQVEVFADPARCARFGLQVTEPFLTGTTADQLLAGVPASCRWEERLPDLSRFDRVVSDNLAEVLALRPDAVLMGSFLWHLALPGAHPAFRERAGALLERHRPLLLGTAPFVSKAAQAVTRFRDIGLVVAPGVAPRRDSAKTTGSLLVASGKGGGVEAQVRELLEGLAQGARPAFDVVYAEPECLPSRVPDWMRRADFSPAMYQSLVSAVIRPGMGTLTDALVAGARLYCFAEDGNVEMADNLAAVETLGVGRSFPGPRGARAALAAARADHGNPSVARSHLAALRDLDFQGASRAIPWILGDAPAGATI
jgi:hypothetical protein